MRVAVQAGAFNDAASCPVPWAVWLAACLVANAISFV